MRRTLDVTFVGERVPCNAGYSNELGKEIFPEVVHYQKMTCMWTPKNPYLYPQQRHYHHETNSTNEMLFTAATEGQRTDVVLMSNEGDKIYAHTFVLSLKSAYFKGMFSGSYKESHDDAVSIPCSTDTLNNLVQFIYIGEINPAVHENLEELCELLEVSHGISPDLFDHCVDLINDCLKKSPLNHPAMIIQLITNAYLFGIDDFLIPCLEAAEKLESDVDWNLIKREHYTKLLITAAECRFENVSGQLSTAINRLLADGLLLSVFEKPAVKEREPEKGEGKGGE